MNLALRNVGGVVVRRDVCADEEFGAYRLTPGERFSGIEPCDPPEARPVPLCVSNPPYSLKWSGSDASLRTFGWELPPKSKADYLFVLDALSRLDEDGMAIFILPHGVLFRGASEGKIRRELVERDLIDAVIGLPDNMFLNTGIPVCVVVFKRHKTDNGVLFVDASKNFEKRGKVNAMRKEDVARIVDAYRNRRDVDKFAHVATFDEIRGNDYNLNIPRYVDTYEYVEPPNLIDCMNDLMQIDEDIRSKEHEPRFLARYQTTINIQVDVFKHLEFEVHNEPETQREIVEAFAMLDERIADEQRTIDRLNDFKSWHLDTMFV